MIGVSRGQDSGEIAEKLKSEDRMLAVGFMGLYPQPGK
jgi:hypothetical protein